MPGRGKYGLGGVPGRFAPKGEREGLARASEDRKWLLLLREWANEWAWEWASEWACECGCDGMVKSESSALRTEMVRDPSLWVKTRTWSCMGMLHCLQRWGRREGGRGGGREGGGGGERKQ